MDSGRHPLPTVLKGEGINPEAILVISDGRWGQAGSLARGQESACFADGQLPVLTHPESLSPLAASHRGRDLGNRAALRDGDGPRDLASGSLLSVGSGTSGPCLSLGFLGEVANWNRSEMAVKIDRQAHRNDMETIYPFLFLGLVYSFLQPNPFVARVHFLLVFLGRVVHTVAYLGKLRAPIRSLAYTLAQRPCASMALQIHLGSLSLPLGMSASHYSAASELRPGD
ncbi:Prostaglandin E synthase [Myotis davidii]|uniref:Prostaglandin E synthase n=1 Tax=Myotis davidii TaxID=225400 RepID=L5LKH0_MYODS|nr:Prostaglandin E synthase [Myotis davidii]